MKENTKQLLFDAGWIVLFGAMGIGLVALWAC